MAKDCDHIHPLQHDGTSQQQRRLPALEPGSARIEDRQVEDWLHYAWRFARHVRYFDENNQPDGNWQAFFDAAQTATLQEINSRSDHEPHFALFICFLKLMQFSRQHINTLPKRHLDFYYKKVLQLKSLPAEADRVHLVFELAKNADQHLVAKGTIVDGGKDADGQALRYALENDLIVNRAQVVHLRSIYKKNETLYFAPIANSADGLGEDFKEEVRWKGFGHPELPLAPVGFALASPLLFLQEGNRLITANIRLSSARFSRFRSARVRKKLSELIKNAISIYASGEEDWLGPYPADSVGIKALGRGSFSLSIQTTVSQEEDPIVEYDPEVLSGDFNTASPLIRIVFDASKTGKFYSLLASATIQSMHIEAKVTEVQDLQLENDFGALDASKAFMPFGPAPRRGSNFFIGSVEAFTKKLQSFKLHCVWKDLPAITTFNEHYQNYGLTLKEKDNTDFKAKLQVLSGKNWGIEKSFTLFNNTLQDASKTIAYTFGGSRRSGKLRQELRTKGKRLAKESMRVEALRGPTHGQVANSGEFVPSIERIMDRLGRRRRKMGVRGRAGRTASSERAVRPGTRRKRRGLPRRKTRRQARPRSFKLQLSPMEKDGFVRLVLERDFGHEIFPTKYALAIAKQVRLKSTDPAGIPNPPYTPLMESIKLDYTATTDEVSFKAPNRSVQLPKMRKAFEEREIQFFHLSPFGQYEAHPYLKWILPFDQSAHISLLPNYTNEGELLIGIENMEPDQSLNLLFQVVEGSANPDRQRQHVNWSLLVHDHWMPLDERDILSDTTNSLLTSGIIRFILPDSTTNDNYRLEEGLVWLRASLPQFTDAVCDLVSVHSQAGRAVLLDAAKSPSHLAAALPAETISKLLNRQPQVKTLSQPYASFGGAVAERDLDYYKRVSERLRHKNRASSVWDFEHLVLERFPSLYKVKCVNHSSANKIIAPGHVSIITIPKLRSHTSGDLLRPKADTHTKAQVKDYLETLCSPFVAIHVQNPDYEEVELHLGVRFKQDFEFGFYKKELNQAIKAFLTPWAFEEGADISFGGRIHKSVLIHYVEKLEYVDFVSEVKMFHKAGKTPNTDTDEITITNAKAILISANEHTIREITPQEIC